jgi:hypothetical protein
MRSQCYLCVYVSPHKMLNPRTKPHAICMYVMVNELILKRTSYTFLTSLCCSGPFIPWSVMGSTTVEAPFVAVPWLGDQPRVGRHFVAVLFVVVL